MWRLKNTIAAFLTSFLLAHSGTSYGIAGFGDWVEKTPHGNEISNVVERVLYLKNKTELKHIDKWYFYKDYVVGRLANQDSPQNILGYFVVNEVTSKIDTFATKSEWDKYLVGHELNPKIWTRWYETDWADLDMMIFFFIFPSWLPFSIPLTLFYIFLIYKAVKKEKFNLRKPYTIIVTSVIILFLGMWLLERFPQSI